MQSKKIAFLSRDLPSLHPNGASWQVHLLANALQKRGHKITVFSMDPKPDEALYDVITCPSPKKVRSLKRLFYPAFFFAENDYSSFDIIHAHGDDYLLHSLKPRLRTFYGSALWEALYDSRLLYRLRQLLFYFFEWISAFRNNSCTGISLATKRALPMVKKVIPCGVDLNFFGPGGEKAKEPTLLFVGNLTGRKRGRSVVQTFLDQILPAHPGARLLLATGEKADFGPGVEVHVRPAAGELLRLYQQAWVLCMASTYEWFGVMILEAWACKTAVVSTSHWGAREIVTHMYDGILCPLHKIGLHVNRLFDNPGFRKELCENGFKAVQRFSVEKVADQYEEMYETL
jgi:phosphatidyl-myo-inositol alpha-mannosyltransferase